MKYQISSTHCLKVVSKVKVFGEEDRMTDRTKTIAPSIFDLEGIKKHGLIILSINKVLGVCRKHSVCSSVCTDTFSTRNFFCFDNGIPCLIHGCITMRRCVSYNYDSRMTFIFDFKVKFERARNFRLLWHLNNMFGPQLFMAYHIWGMVLSP